MPQRKYLLKSLSFIAETTRSTVCRSAVPAGSAPRITRRPLGHHWLSPRKIPRNCHSVRFPTGFLTLTMIARPSQAPREGEAVCTDGTVAREGQSTGTPSASTSRKTPATFTTASGHKGLVEKEGG